MTLKNQYDKLLEQVKTDDFYLKIDLNNRVNCYVCQHCNHITKTVDVDAGVTPFLHGCEECGELASSSFYKDIAPSKEPTEEWYRPNWEEFEKLNKAVQDHILNGGLSSRRIIKGTKHGALKTEYKYIQFVAGHGTDWTIWNTKSGDYLGNLEYYKNWKEWQLIPEPKTGWTKECLVDVVDFIKQLEAK